jgi:hypothetical protein
MDEIVLTLPRERPFGAVAGLVLGGVAARHDVTLDVLDDLQLALDGLLDHDESDGEVTVVLSIAQGSLRARVGPLGSGAVAELRSDDGRSLGLRRLLDTVVDSVELTEHEGGEWVEIRKAYALAGEPG